MISQLMTVTAHEDGSDKSGWEGSVFSSTGPNELRVNVCDPLRWVSVVELEVIKSKEKLHQG
jgi:hypothetical protein